MLLKTKRYFVLTLLYVVISWSIQSQNTVSKTKPSKEAFAEKIYIQLSNTIFTTDKTIWFKAIVTNAIDHIPTKVSGIVYVELIDFDKKVIDTKKLKLENAIADSFFQLNEVYPPGRYLIRAYTEWNKNFEQDFIFNQYINLFSPNEDDDKLPIQNITLTETDLDQYKISAQLFPENLKADYKKDLQIYIHSDKFIDSVEVKRKNGAYILDYILPKETITAKLKIKLEDTKLKNNNYREESSYSKTVAVNKDFLDVQFFPEGGKMIDGLTSKVAFKAINYKSLGAGISGQILDENDSIIAFVKTNPLGMGYTLLKPYKNKKYYGKIINDDGTIYKYELPKVHDLGYVLTATEIGNYLDVKVETNFEMTDSLSLQVKTRGVLLQEYKFKLENKFHEALIEKQQFREGIISITLFDKNSTPLCERLFFNLNEDNRLNVLAEPQRKYHSQRDKTTLNFVVKNTNDEPSKANISALIIDKNQLGNSQKLQPHILSYFLLNSELKGNIENPNYYFDETNIYRKRDLEALMLTQGWRNYVFKKPETNYNFSIKPETDLWVSGTVRSTFNKNKVPKKGVDLTMLTFGNPRGAFTQKVDSTGHFAFNLNNQYADKLNVVIQSTNKRGLAKEYNITLDKSTAPPKIVYEEQETIELVDTIIKPFLQRSIAQKKLEDDFKTSSNTVELDAVELTGYKLTPLREKIIGLHGKPDVVIDNDDLEKENKKWSYGLYSVLLFSFPDDLEIKMVGGQLDRFQIANVYGSDFTFILFDGIPVEIQDYNLIPNIDINQVSSFEIIKNPKRRKHYVLDVFGYDPFTGKKFDATLSIINIITYSGKGFFGLSQTKGIFKGVIDGFSTKREFYAPKYDNLQSEDWDIPDLRSVIHWSPNITTDENGESKIEFYNADTTGDMLIVVEAIATDGKMGYFQTTYNVEEKIEK